MVDELREDVFGFGEQHEVLLFAELLHAGVEVGEQREAAVVFAQQVAGVPVSEVRVVDVAHSLQQGSQLRGEAAGGRTLFAPFVVRVGGLRDAGFVGFERTFGRGVEPLGESRCLVGEVVEGESRGVDDPEGLAGGIAELLFGGFGEVCGAGDDASQLFSGASVGQCRLVLLLEDLAREGEDSVADIPFESVVDALLDELREPALEVAVDGDLFDQGVGALREHRRGFDLDVVVQVDSQLLDESAEDALEEGVDGEDREARIVVEDLCADFGGAFPDGLFVEGEFFRELRQIGAVVSGREVVNLLEDAGFHLLGGLVGEGHGEDMPVKFGLLDHVADVLEGQLVGFSGAGAGIQDLRSLRLHCSEILFGR